MAEDDFIDDRRRASEEDYFRKQDRELIEKMRRAAAASRAQSEMSAKTGLKDPALIEELGALGFTPETIMLLPLVPMLEVAWAESGISAAERKGILEVARARGLVDGSVADRQLKTWLEQRPSVETFRKARRLIGAIVDHVEPGRTAMTADELLKYCEAIAHASGGLFGIGSVSAEEQAALQRIASDLKKR